MSLVRRAAAVTSMAALLTAAAAAPALGHQTWFVDHPDSYPLDWSALTSPLTAVAIAAAFAVAALWRVAARQVPTPEIAALRPLSRLVPWVPRLLAAHLGLSLLLLTLRGNVLDPSVQAGEGLVGAALLAPQLLAGALLLAGVAVRAAAWGVVAAGPVLVVLHGPGSLLICAVLVGVALFLVFVPPQRSEGGRARFETDQLRVAALALRVGAAVSLISLAVVEKLANPAMGAAMLEQQPVLNLLAPLGVSAAHFVVFAGAVELLFGLLVLSGATPQVVGLVAAVPFTATLALFGTTELIGHLPVYGVLLVFVVMGSRADTSAQLSWLPSRSDRREPVAA